MPLPFLALQNSSELPTIKKPATNTACRSLKFSLEVTAHVTWYLQYGDFMVIVSIWMRPGKSYLLDRVEFLFSLEAIATDIEITLKLKIIISSVKHLNVLTLYT